MNKIEDKKISEEIFEKIRRGEVRMLPKSYFWLKSALYATTSAFAVILAAFFIVLVFYVMKINGFLDLPNFGLKGLRDLILSLPLFLLAIAVFFAGTAAMFLKNYPATYRRPLIYSVGALLLLFSFGLFATVKAVDLRRAVYNEVENGEVPIISAFYDYIKEDHPRNVEKGRVETVYVNGFLMRAEKDEDKLRVVYNPQTSFYLEGEEIRSGDYVIVHGNKNGNTIGAFVIEKIK